MGSPLSWHFAGERKIKPLTLRPLCYVLRSRRALAIRNNAWSPVLFQGPWRAHCIRFRAFRASVGLDR
jgi:hypothetical protein